MSFDIRCILGLDFTSYLVLYITMFLRIIFMVILNLKPQKQQRYACVIDCKVASRFPLPPGFHAFVGSPPLEYIWDL